MKIVHDSERYNNIKPWILKLFNAVNALEQGGAVRSIFYLFISGRDTLVELTLQCH